MSQISVIICTTAEARRAKTIWRAIDSVTTAQPKPAIPIVVANGTKFDRSLIQALKKESGIRFFYREEGDLPKARYFGRQCVETEYFGFLDDDDEYLPQSLSRRQNPLDQNSEIDATVANGFRVRNGQRRLYMDDLDSVLRDPAASLVEANWLASCAGLYRTSTVGNEFFDPEIRDLEWTYTALRLSLTRRILFLPDPAFAVHEYPNSLSRNSRYTEGMPRAIEQLLQVNMPSTLRSKFRFKLCAAFHDLSNDRLEDGLVKAAWQYHLRSLLHPRALFRYGLNTRKFLWSSRHKPLPISSGR